jgi:hypothetical protein
VTVKVYKSLLTGEEFTVVLKDRDPLARQDESGVQEKLSAISRDFSKNPTIVVAPLKEIEPDLFDLYSPDGSAKNLLNDIQRELDKRDLEKGRG